MSKPIPYLLQGKNIILVVDGKSHTISKETHISYGKIVDALKAKDWDSLRDLVEPKKAIINFGKGNVTIDGSVVKWKGQVFHNALANRMIEMYQDGFPIEPMIRFMENLMANPSKRSVDQVYGFLEKNSLPITEDGFFLAFKRVNHSYLDIHSGTIDNSVGKIVEMDRNLVDDNPDSHCSTGLHFCSESYLGSFGSANEPVMILKINPADVVSIPTDYNGAKGRCMKYEVVAEVSGDPKSAFSAVVNKDYTPAPKAKAAPAPKVATPTPAPKWPFPNAADLTTSNVWPPKAKSVQLYDLQRVRNSVVEYAGMTFKEAESQMLKNISQKKAQLKMVVAGTDDEV
jgi:hypothetical protein